LRQPNWLDDYDKLSRVEKNKFNEKRKLLKDYFNANKGTFHPDISKYVEEALDTAAVGPGSDAVDALNNLAPGNVPLVLE